MRNANGAHLSSKPTPGSDVGPETIASLLAVVRELLIETQPQRSKRITVTLDSRLGEDLGFDSLARVELISRIEDRFGVGFPERAFAEADTPRDLLRLLPTARTRQPTSARPAVAVSARPSGEEGAPDNAHTLLEMLEWHVATHPQRQHIQFYQDDGAGPAITYGQLHEQATRTAAGLQQRGIDRGEPVAIMLPTGPEYFYSFFGVLLAGGVPVSMYPPARPAQIGDHLRRHVGILNNCRARVLITVEEATAFSRLLKSLTEEVRDVITWQDIATDTAQWAAPKVAAPDTAFLQYTSGSTGNPKGVVLSHANLLANIRAMGQAVAANADDVFVSWLPLYHDMGLIGAWLGSLYYGSLFVVMSPLNFIARPERWLWAIHHHRGTLSAAPNFAYELCVRRIDQSRLEGLDLSTWRAAFNGAEPVDPTTLEQFCERFHAYGLRRESAMPVYGLAESSVGLAFPPLNRGPIIDRVEREAFMSGGRARPAAADNATALRFPSCGVALPRHQIRIIDDSGRELGEREEGRLEFRGPSSTSGYFRNPEATQKLFDGDWLDSGDKAYVADGEVFITGRVKDIIIRAGRNIYPHELEEAVGAVEGIRQGRVAVFGSADRNAATERLVVMAETRLRGDQEQDRARDEIQSIAVALTGEPADEVLLVPPNTVLKTSSGKVRRAGCKDLYEKGLIGKQQAAPWRQLLRISLQNSGATLRRLRRTAGSFAFAGYLWFLLIGLAIPTWVLVATLPRLSWRWASMGFFARLLIKVSGIPFQVRGLHDLPPPGSPAIMISNHASYLDGIILCAVLPYPVCFIAKAELKKQFIPRVFLQGIGAEFVERFEKDKSIADAQRFAQLAGSGHPVFYFPEGTFTRQPGLLSFRMGAFLAAAQARAPIVPITLRGTRSVLRSDIWFPRFHPIAVHIGKPIPPREETADSDRDRWRQGVQLRDIARSDILKQSGEPDLGEEKHPID